jgi:hypothetical protein
MACSNTHNATTKVQGPGVCCAALGTQTPVLGLRFGATDKNGHCFVCEIAASTSKKNPGHLKFKRGKSAGICPTSTGGCCSLAAA